MNYTIYKINNIEFAFYQGISKKDQNKGLFIGYAEIKEFPVNRNQLLNDGSLLYSHLNKRILHAKNAEKGMYKKAYIYAREGEKCFYCEDYIPLKYMTKDHLHPRSKGGKDNLENLVLCCAECNKSKGSLTITDFMEKVTTQKNRMENIINNCSKLI